MQPASALKAGFAAPVQSLMYNATILEQSSQPSPLI